MRLLVTGGAGFIGSNFVRFCLTPHLYPDGSYADFQREFAAQVEKLIVFDKLTYAGVKANLAEFEAMDMFEFVEADLADYESLERVIEEQGIDTIAHFAAETHVDRSIEGPRAFVDSNIIGTFNLLEILRHKPEIRMHHVSTDEVFGELPLDKPEIKFNEHTPYEPRSPYSASKAASDHLVRAYANTYNSKVTISNCSNNYGPYCFPEKLIPLVITRALSDQPIPVYGDGRQVRDWIHVEDHCSAVALCLLRGKLGETYMFGGNGERENIWIVRQVLKLLGKPESLIVHVGERKGHDQRYAVDYSKAQRELGFEPLKPIEERLAETVAWYQANEDWWRPLKPQADKIAERYLAAAN